MGTLQKAFFFGGRGSAKVVSTSGGHKKRTGRVQDGSKKRPKGEDFFVRVIAINCQKELSYISITL